MKRNLITLILALFTVCAFAQVKDTVYIETINGVDYSVNQTINDAGIITCKKRPIESGDTFKSDIYGFASAQTRELARNANKMWEEPEKESLLISLNTLLDSYTNMNLFELSTSFIDSLYVGSWKISTNSGTTFNDAAVSLLNNTFTITVGANNYPLLPVGNTWLRVQGVPAGARLYRVFNAGRIEFRSLDQSVIIYKE